MSSTNRGSDYHHAGYYVTPISAVMDFLATWNHPVALGADILDPCAGGDEANPMSYPTALRRYYGETGGLPRITTLDIRPDSRASICADYLTWEHGGGRDLIITNPPFNLAVPIIQKALTEITPDGFVVMLLRLNFLGGKERSKWLKTHMPREIYVHSRRMKFLNTAGTDSIEYAHFVWGKEHCPETKIYII